MKKFDPRILPYAGAAVQAILFAIAGYFYFDLGAWGAVAGFGVGAVVNLSLAVASSRISDIAEKRKPLARLALFGMFLLSPTTIALSFFAPKSIPAAIAWAMDVDLAIVLAGSISGKSLLATGEPATSEPKRKKKPAKPASQPVEPATEPAKPALFCKVAGCERNEATPGAKPFGSQSALNAHQRSHKQIVGYTASFEPVTKDQVKKG
jgi:hypothetical protein